MKEVLLVMGGGAAGALARYGVNVLFTELKWSPIGATMTANIVGSFALGILFAMALNRSNFNLDVLLLLSVGFLGSFTTFSTLMWATFDLAKEGSVSTAAMNVGVSLAAGLAAVGLGYVIGRQI